MLGVRSDFIAHCARFPELSRMIAGNQIPVGPMRADELREAIEHPATLVGCTLEPGLTELLLADVRHEPGSLPLLEFTLDELWQLRDADKRLTLRAYDDLGGVRARYKSMPTKFSTAFRPVKAGLSALGRRSGAPGRGNPGCETTTTAGAARGADGPEQPLLLGVLQELQDQRLVTTSPDGTLYEIAHEALIREWPRLREWLETERANEQTRRQLAEAAMEWEDNEFDEGYLYRGRRLERHFSGTRRTPRPLAWREQEFLEKSVEADRRSGEDARRADHHERVNRARWLAMQAASRGSEFPQHRLLLAVEAVRATRDHGEGTEPAAESELHAALSGIGGRALRRHMGGILAVAFAADGRLVTAGNDGVARLWDRSSPRSDAVELCGHDGLDHRAGRWARSATWSPRAKTASRGSGT